MPRRQVSTESYGLGQSGYTAGRRAGDRALDLADRNISYPRDADERTLEAGVDERWSGAGGRAWVPREPAED